MNGTDEYIGIIKIIILIVLHRNRMKIILHLSCESTEMNEFNGQMCIVN